jgi:hypothetical protein
VRIPVACSLADTEAHRQLDGWRRVLESPAVQVSRISPTVLEIRWADDLDQLEAVVRLARLEKACCPFFDFTIRIEADMVALSVSVPDDAVAVLDGLTAGLQPGR